MITHSRSCYHDAACYHASGRDNTTHPRVITPPDRVISRSSVLSHLRSVLSHELRRDNTPLACYSLPQTGPPSRPRNWPANVTQTRAGFLTATTEEFVGCFWSVGRPEFVVCCMDLVGWSRWVAFYSSQTHFTLHFSHTNLSGGDAPINPPDLRQSRIFLFQSARCE